jgi:hypothetical protein
MPKTKAEPDPDFVPGKSRKSGLYDPKKDTRGVYKELLELKCK